MFPNFGCDMKLSNSAGDRQPQNVIGSRDNFFYFLAWRFAAFATPSVLSAGMNEIVFRERKI